VENEAYYEDERSTWFLAEVEVLIGNIQRIRWDGVMERHVIYTVTLYACSPYINGPLMDRLSTYLVIFKFPAQRGKNVFYAG
jgi:hypothetical protein